MDVNIYIYIYIYIFPFTHLGKKKKTNKQTHTGSPVHLLGQTFQLCLDNGNNISFYLLHSYNYIPPTIVFLLNWLFLSLFISATLTTWSIRGISSRSSLFSYSLLSVNSLFFLKKKFIFYFNTLHNLYLFFNFCLNVGKQWKRGETLNLYLGFFVFLFYIWISPLVEVVIVK